MKKKLFALIIAVLLTMALTAPCFADGARCVDNANLLSPTELESVIEKLDEVSQKHGVDICVLTTSSTYGDSVEAYADNFYDQSAWGQGSDRSGIMLMLSMEERDWYISTCGEGIEAVTDYGISYIGQQIISDLSLGDYEAGFERFADVCDEMLSQAESGKPYDVDNKVDEKHGFNLMGGIVSLFIGAMTALFPTLMMKNDLKSVGNQVKASNYIKQGSLNLTNKSDTFLYRHVASVPIVHEDSHGGSSPHVSVGGMTHGGGGGKF